ncbi:HEAT repeat domain-containing protein [Actomonas aquatica]|uniref:HEAT repeat domain-containing protein n=1 Tax=Actomonas aquatica TaxID=2866162 RepID=A0ABZ1CCW0_9BACT|nr:HEAT repeat domain-containing protein [Opitutus sp. WL0086]WRQ89266.1 HEAT repeat domain-containing protein [Opitutus sp. WL0086]
MSPRFFLLAAATCCALCASLTASEITPLIDALNADDYAARQSARLELRQTLVDAPARDLRAYERELLANTGPEHDWATRDWTLRMLELVGSKSAVKPLAKLLNDEDPRVRDLARRALSAIPSSSAAAALEKAALKAPAAERDGYADALAYRAEARAVRELAALLKEESADAALALGKIGNRAAQKALVRAHESATGNFKLEVEWALLDSGYTSRAMVDFGGNEAIRTAAFAALLKQQPNDAASVLKAVLADAAHVDRGTFLRAAMDSALSETVVAMLPDLGEDEQRIVLGAIADLGLSTYEPSVLALLATASPELKPVVIRTLGLVGSAESFQPLLDLYLADGRDRDAAGALARLQAPLVDASLLATAQGDGPVEDRAAALRLLVLRNTDGVTALLNGFADAANPPALREAAFTGMEVVGDADSVRLLLAAILNNDPQKRDAQGSLKKLSAVLGVPDYQWTELYAPAMQLATDDGRRDILAILDGASGPAAAAYLQDLVIGDDTLAPEAMNSLRRWTDISGVDAWLAIATDANSTDEEVAMAKQGIIRLIRSTRVTGLYPVKVMKAAESLRALANDDAFRLELIKTYDRKLHWQTRSQILGLFPEFADDPVIGEAVTELIDRATFR